MTEHLREGVVARQPAGALAARSRCDEVYVVAGHKGHPEAVGKGAPEAGAGG